MPTVLITGGSGFIGLHTARAFLDHGYDVIVTQFRVRREPPFIADFVGNRLKREAVDVTSPYAVNDVFKKNRIDDVVHLAVPGLGALSAAEEFRSNMLCLLNVLDATQSHGIKRITIASSVTAYGGLKGPFHETTPLPVASKNSTNAYKKAEEILGLHFGQATGLEVVCARIGYIYGPLYHSMTNAPSRFVHAAVRGMNEKIETAPFADNYNDYCYVRDTAEGLRLLQTTPSLSARVYNIGSGRAWSNAQVAEAVRKAAPAAKLILREGKQEGAGGPDDYLDLSLIARDTGYAPKYDIEKGCFEYVQWVKQNEY